MRFLHTADWQIGMKAAHLGAKAEQVRQARLTAARRVVEAAGRSGADFILLAGDTFEHHGVHRQSIAEVARILGSAACPVYVIPGNHDRHGVAGAVWSHDVWKQAANVQVLLVAEPVAVPGGTLFPCPVSSDFCGDDPTAWIAGAPGAGIRIGMAHGSVDSVPDRSHSYPIARNAAERGRLDYLALGHYHSRTMYRDERGVERMAYSGTHEPTSFGERESGCALLVEIARPGAPPVVELLAVGALRWVQFHRRISAPGQLAALRLELEQLRAPESMLVECRLDGTLFDGEQDETVQLEEMIASRYLFGRLEQSGLLADPVHQRWIDDLPPGFLRAAAERLREAASAPAATGADHQALRDFALLWREVNR